MSFTIANVPADLAEIEQAGGLAKALHEAVSNPSATRLQVVYVGPKPDLLRHEAQAIVTGKMGEDGVFYADELLLKCPTRYEEGSPTASRGRMSLSGLGVRSVPQPIDCRRPTAVGAA